MKKVRTNKVPGVKILELNRPLKSGRMYLTEDVELMLQDPTVKERLNNNDLYGILNDNGHNMNDSSISNADIAFMTTNLYIKDEINN